MTAAMTSPHPEEWHDERRTGVGGSDIAIIAGLSPYGRGVHDLYMEKRGEGIPFEVNDQMEAGWRLEPVVADWYRDRTGRQVVKANRLIRHPDYPWAIGHLDRKVRGDRRLVEIKTTRSRRWGPRDIPPDVECQVQWYMGITRYPVCDVVVLIAGSTLQITEVPADEAYFRDLLVLAGEFWARVEQGNPPPIDGSPSAARYLAGKYPWHRAESLLAPTPDFDELATLLRDARAAKATAEAAEGAVTNAIKELLGDAEGVQGAGYKVTWKHASNYPKTDWAAVAAGLRPHAPDQYDALTEAHTKEIDAGRRFVATFEGDNA